MWTPYGVLLGEFIFPVFRGGVHVVQMEQLESTWILDKKLAGLPPKKKCLKSTWTPGIDLDSTWTPHGICGGG